MFFGDPFNASDRAPGIEQPAPKGQLASLKFAASFERTRPYFVLPLQNKNGPAQCAGASPSR
jgi:hypothetical protein